jgi:alkylation response protein AidB-like acyl-CoA dehydrogenase
MRPTSAPASVRDGDRYVINGRKWWTSGAGDPRCAIAIVMGQTRSLGAEAPAAIDGAGCRWTRRA